MVGPFDMASAAQSTNMLQCTIVRGGVGSMQASLSSLRAMPKAGHGQFLSRRRVRHRRFLGQPAPRPVRCRRPARCRNAAHHALVWLFGDRLPRRADRARSRLSRPHFHPRPRIAVRRASHARRLHAWRSRTASSARRSSSNARGPDRDPRGDQLAFAAPPLPSYRAGRRGRPRRHRNVPRHRARRDRRSQWVDNGPAGLR